LFLLLTIPLTNIQAQGYLKTEYISSSDFKNKEGQNFGSGDYMKVSARYNYPLSIKQNDLGQAVLWSVSFNGSYGLLNNKGSATAYNPDNILNTSVNLTHIRPVSGKWSLLATFGAGIYSAPNEITTKSILVNGGLIFIYKVRNNFDLGVGLGLTNSFGPPIVMPMSLINWRLSGKYEVKVDIASGIEVSGALKFNDKFKFRVVAIEIDGISCVMNMDGESMIYASTTIKSFLSPEYKIDKKSTLYVGAGGAWLRSTTLTKRSLKEFFKNMFNNENSRLGFSSSGYFTIGYRYGF